MRLVFAANLISMLGSGLNAAAVTWYILQRTGSEMNLALLVVMQTAPAMLLLPFSGVVIDREDRRRLVMLLDATRGLVILAVAILAMRHSVQLWQLYLMNMLVAAGFWVFWPTITALIQELTPDSEFVHANTFLMAGVQGGWLIAGSVVGFLYNHVGLGPILLIDFCTYVISFLLYFGVRRGRHTVAHPDHPHAGDAVARYFHELKEGFKYVRGSRTIVALGLTWALFLGGMLTQGITTAPLSERILGSGAVGYGFLNGAWGIGAFLSAVYAAWLMRKASGRFAVFLGMAVLTLGMLASPFSRVLPVAVFLFLLMGSARGLVGIAITTTIMELVPKHMMGRVQNMFYFLGMLLQVVLGLAVGWTAHFLSLTLAFVMIGATYAAGVVLTALARTHAPQREAVEATS